MGKTRVAITLEDSMVRKVDRWVKAGRYHSRSEAIEDLLKAASSTSILKRLLLWQSRASLKKPVIRSH